MLTTVMMMVIKAEIDGGYSPAVDEDELISVCSSANCMHEQASCLMKVPMKLRNSEMDEREEGEG